MTSGLHMDIPAAWQFVRKVKRLVEEALYEYPEALRYSSGMVASELIGNAIKYSDRGDDLARPKFSVEVIDEQVVIEVSNPVRSEKNVEQVRTRIAQLANSNNREEFYLNRLQELMSGSCQGSQLGLYRIGYEGEFELSCTYTETDHVLTIRATRGLS